MRDLNYQLKQLCRNNRDGGYRTQQTRERVLTLIANQLHDLGYRGMQAHSLKPKHVEALIRRWQAEELSTGTLKNRLSALRWWAQKGHRQNVVARQNDHYGVPSRVFVTNVSKATSLDEIALEQVRDPHVRMSLELQAAFGLRREEAIKFAPSYADRGDHLVLKPSWTKGGRARVVPIRTDAQRDVLCRAHQLVGRGSLIPSTRNYRHQLRVYERHTADVGFSKLHGLRHRYAQVRYEELTGWKAPAAGYPRSRVLSREQRVLDENARLAVSRELGHEREAITAVYLGR
jgi:site-specific recombinase XerC